METDWRGSGTHGGGRVWREPSAPVHTRSVDPNAPPGIASEAPIRVSGTPCPGGLAVCERCPLPDAGSRGSHRGPGPTSQTVSQTTGNAGDPAQALR